MMASKLFFKKNKITSQLAIIKKEILIRSHKISKHNKISQIVLEVILIALNV